MTATTLTVLVALLVVAALVGWRTLSSPAGTADTTTRKHHGPRCDPGLRKGDLVRAREVTVSVYNAGSRSGLAAQTQDELAARGFIPGEAANAPAGYGSVRVVRVFAPRAEDPAARLVALQFGKHTVVQATKRSLGPGVDVVVGNDFVGLVKAPQSVRATIAGSGC